MAIVQKPLKSDTGFESPGFTVDTSGNVSFSGALQQGGVPVLTSTTIAGSVVYSSLTTLGTLSELTVNGDVEVTGGDVTIDATGVLTITSTTTGSIDNVTIGLTSPTTGQFTTITVTDAIVLGGQQVLTSNPISVRTLDNYTIGSIVPRAATFTSLAATTGVNLSPTSVGSINNTSIGATTAATGRFTSVTLTAEPTETNQATTKNYVDGKISAYAIALGS